jgi:hypothetical protein
MIELRSCSFCSRLTNQQNPSIRKEWKMKPTLMLRISIVMFLIASACSLTAQATPTLSPVQSTSPATEPPTVSPPPTSAPPTTALEAGFELLPSVANRDPSQSAQSAALAVAGDTGNPWITWAEDASGGLRQIFVDEISQNEFLARGASLNLHLNVVADTPTITFTGPGRTVPWVAWSEPSPGFGDVAQVFASRFSKDTGLWQQAGQDRGGSEPSLNFSTRDEARVPFIFGGSTDPINPPVPWVTWEEDSPSVDASQIFVAKAVKDDTAIGGFHWEFVGALNQSQEPTLNVDRLRDARHPALVFAETGNAVPWVTWYEEGGNRPKRVFTARGVLDPGTPGGLKWVRVPDCGTDEVACSLNTNPTKDAEDPTIAAGSLTPGDAPVPWIAWSEIGPSGKSNIFVSRLDKDTRNSFLNVGASLNIDQNHDAKTPFITFVGNVPYVAWLEDDGTGNFVVQVRHLSSDPQTGTWTQDSPADGFSAQTGFSALGLGVTASDALTLAWPGGDASSAVAQLFVGQLVP